LVSIPADAAATAGRNSRFQVIDLGKGRVALKAANDRFVSASEEAVTLKDLAEKDPGDAESFQWVNLMRGDALLMSLTNHRYLTTRPNNPGPVTVTATGPTPARRGGECFKWTAVE
jgi:xylan 1,4-beta-xylosidase